MNGISRVLVILLLAGVCPGLDAVALPQQAVEEQPVLTRVCGSPVSQPSPLPPAGPVFLAMALCFEQQGGISLIDPETYLHYIEARPSDPARGQWIRYEESLEATLLGDFRRLWATRFLDDLSIDVQDHPLPNGVMAKIVVFNIEERQRVRIVDYAGLEGVSRGDIDEALKERGIGIGLDAFLDRGVLRQVSSAVLALHTEKGFPYAEVKPVIKEVTSGPKLVHVTFEVTPGPRVAIRDVEFTGNREVPDVVLAGALKVNKAQGLLSFIGGGGTYQATSTTLSDPRIRSGI